MTLRNTFQKPIRVLMILAALIVVTGLVIGWNTDEMTMQTAIGQTNDTLQTSEDFQFLERANRAFINLVKQTRPAVVQITTQTQQVQRRMSRNPFSNDVYRFFFGPDFNLRPEPERDPEPMTSLGSGVIVREDGYILTNNHVIDNVDHITVTLANGREYPAELVGNDPGQRNRNGGGSDLALLKIDADNLPALQFGDSDALEVGEWVIAIGSPLGLTQTVTRGIVSAKGRNSSRMVEFGNFIQTDAPINRGNSGGALVNISGELVGINTLIATGGYTMGNIGIGFAIPSNLAQQLMPSLIEEGRVVRGWLGITMNPVDHDLADKLQFEEPRGVVVEEVVQGSPAEKAGIQPRDIILEFDGEVVRDINHLRYTVAAKRVGKPIKLKVLRKGTQEKQLTVKLAERTAETVARANREFLYEEQEQTFAGLRVRNLTPAIAERYGYPSNETGVIITEVADDSDAARQGIRPGFLIQEIEWEPVDNLDTYIQLVTELKKQNKEKVLLYIKSPNGLRGGYITVRISASDR